MKTLKNHTILFDAECPMCRVISRGLVGSGLTSEEGTVAYQEFPETVCPMLDRQRAADEIALINDDTGEVSYGIESLFKLLASSYPRFRPLLSFRPLIWIMAKLYRFIASNRRVIVPPAGGSGRSGIQPTFRMGYRLAYIALCWLITALILSDYLRLPGRDFFVGGSHHVHMILAGLLIVQGAVTYILNKSKVWDYAGNVMTIVGGGSILLLPVLLLASWTGRHPLIIQISLALLFLLMSWEHMRRCKSLELGAVPGLTWLLYFLLVFSFISEPVN